MTVDDSERLRLAFENASAAVQAIAQDKTDTFYEILRLVPDDERGVFVFAMAKLAAELMKRCTENPAGEDDAPSGAYL